MILASVAGSILLTKRLVIPAFAVYNDYENDKTAEALLNTNPFATKILNEKYEVVRAKLGVSDQDSDELQIEVLSILEECTESKNVRIEKVEIETPGTSQGYLVYFNKVSIQGNFEPLLRSLNCLETSLKLGLVSSVNFELDEKDGNLYLHLVIQNLVST